MIRRRARESLVDFAQAIEVPGKPASNDPDEWVFLPVESQITLHHRVMLNACQRCMSTPHGRLMVFAPPGSAKSTYVSVVAPTWGMGKWPGLKVILGSYASDIARRQGRRARQVVRSPSYGAIFRAAISRETSAADDWALNFMDLDDHGRPRPSSEFLAGGLLSGLTGNRAHGIAIDDPIKGRDEADSKIIRDKTYAAYTDDLKTRIVPGAWIILVQTRWHVDDLAGRLLPKDYRGQSGIVRCTDGFDWTVLNMPAQAEHEDDPLGRAIGQYLWPEWFTPEHWSNFKSEARTWGALFQQRPTVQEGNVFKRSWIQRFETVPDEASIVVHSWDTAQKEAEHNDPSAGLAFRTTPDYRRHHLFDVIAERLNYPKLKQQVIDWAYRDHPHAILIEDKGHGTALIQEFQANTRLPVVALEPEGNKILRASNESGAVEAGQLWLPYRAPWLVDYEEEFFGFPEGVAHDDQVDATSQYLKWCRLQLGRLGGQGTGVARAATEAGHTARVTDNGYGSVSVRENADAY
jgi:predicted phage terminase large subunit-like protein